MNETWKAIEGFEGVYEVSSTGRVRRLLAGCGTQSGRIRKLVERNGYLQIVLSKNNKVSLHWVHQLVAQAFIAKDPLHNFVNHLDGNRKNNTPENLEWTTHSGNILHAYRTGLKIPSPSPGSKNGNAILTEADIPVIRSLIGTETLQKIGDRYVVTKNLIWAIKSGRAWRHA